MDALTDEQIEDALASLPGWEYDGEAITKSYAWESFRDAIDFVNDVADLAEDENHHPDIEVYFDEVVISFRTHSADSVTSRDVEMAGEVEDMLEEDDDLEDFDEDVEVLDEFDDADDDLEDDVDEDD
jgi:4a-hydroxytetrahydrobiopterin dehydratase